MRINNRRIVSIVSGLLLAMAIHAENIIYPHVKVGISDVSGIVDVTLPPYSADRTGTTDVTAILQRAFDEHRGWTVMYLPNGTYLVSNTIRMGATCITGGGPGGTGCYVVPILQGQSRKGAVIKLANGSFTNAAAPKPVVFTGDGVAQNMDRGVHNLTILVGANNAGANGIYFYGNNQALMSDVDVISADGQANIGIDLGYGEQGPSMVARAYVKGFKYGVKSAPLNGVTMTQISLEGQSVYGIWHTERYLWIDSLTSNNSVPAINSTGDMTVINAVLTGGSSTRTAIMQQGGVFFARNITAQGYQKALSANAGTPPSGLRIEEFSSAAAASLWTGRPTHTMNLPIKRPPEPLWEQDTAKIANIEAYMGGLGGNRRSPRQALQVAIDDPKNTMVRIPSGKNYLMDDTIFVRGNITRICGPSTFSGAGPIIITDEGTAPVVKIEKLICAPPIIKRTSRTVILQELEVSGSSQFGDTSIFIEAPGDAFIASVCAVMNISNPKAHVWAWHYNAEGLGNDLQVNAGLVWIFGWKDEHYGIKTRIHGGATEILGFLEYADAANKGSDPIHQITDADFCIAGMSHFSFGGGPYSVLVSETRAGVTRTLPVSSNPSGQSLPLFIAYDSAHVATAVCNPPRAAKAADNPDDMGISLQAGMLRVWGPAAAVVRLIDARGAVVASSQVITRTPSTALQCGGLPAGAYWVRVNAGYLSRTQRIVLVK